MKPDSCPQQPLQNKGFRFEKLLLDMSLRPAYLLFCLGIAIAQATTAQENIVIGNFSQDDLSAWQHHSFKRETSYQIITDSQWGKVLKAVSQDSASGLYRQQKIDLSKTPFLNWRWKVTQPLNSLKENTKAGDDYAARVYVIVDGGLLFWQKKSINYIWSSNAPKNSLWPNAYTGAAVQMVALRDPKDALNTWFSEKRNIRDDLKTLLHLDDQAIDAVALMTDTDNSHGQAVSFYGDVFFSAQ